MAISEKEINQINGEKIEQVGICKIFHVYTRRNEWANWDGDTHMVRRANADQRWIKMSLQTAEDFAETQRNRGTKLFIDELPAIYCKSKTGYMIISHVFTEAPFNFINQKLKHETERQINSIEDAFNFIPKEKWVAFVYASKKEKLDSENNFYKRSSVPGNYLGWQLSQSKINTAHLNKLEAFFKSKLLKD